VTDLRGHVDALRAAGDLVDVDDRVHWADTAAAVGVEAARANGPAVLLTDAGGDARLLAGGFGGPDRLAVRAREPWSRLAAGMGLGYDVGYLSVLDTLAAARQDGAQPELTDPAATTRAADLHAVGLPAVGDADVPTVTLGLAAVPSSTTPSPTDVEAVSWVPVRGSVHGSDGLRLVVPDAAVASTASDTPVTVVLGAPPAALVAALVRWVGEAHGAAASRIAAALGTAAVASTPAGPVPAGSEVVVEGVIRATGDGAPPPAGPPEPWEAAVTTATLDTRVDRVRTRDAPLVAFSPTGAPMADGRMLLSIVESARLYGRVNNYWGVAPVEWVALPAEAGLGICLVASEILYAGFEWQLANTLFSFSRLFDKVVVLDTETPPMDLARAFDDVWVKAHPANDWEFSDSAAPAATAPQYRRDGSTGANVYVNAAWDPRWDEEYIAPRVSFEATYPADLRATVRADWEALGFAHGPAHEPGADGGEHDRGDEATDAGGLGGR
jgi:4-hydroxy-3-polyprenylbenzoate decarboxylase